MAKLKKQTVDYFSHYCIGSAALRILQRKYGNDGYAVYYKLQDMLGSTPHHYIDCSNSDIWQDLLSYLGVTEIIATEIINFLSKEPFDEIDNELWIKNKIIWSDSFIDRIKDVYTNRKAEIPIKPEIKPTTNLQQGYEQSTTNLQVDYGKTTEQIKLNKSKVNNINYIADSDKENGQEVLELTGEIDEPPSAAPTEQNKSLIPKTKKQKPERSPEDLKLFNEIKAYFVSRDSPIFNWAQESEGIYRLIKFTRYALKSEPDPPILDFIKTATEKFIQLAESHHKLFDKKPATPSVIASGLWPHLLENMKEVEKKLVIDSYLDEIFSAKGKKL